MTPDPLTTIQSTIQSTIQPTIPPTTQPSAPSPSPDPPLALTYSVFSREIPDSADKKAIQTSANRHSLDAYQLRDGVSIDQFIADNLTRIVLCARFKSYDANHRRNDDNVLDQPSVLFLDYDDESYSVSDFERDFSEYRYLVVASRSHQIEKHGVVCDRFHAYLFLDSPIRSKQEWKLTREYVLRLHPSQVTLNGPVKFSSVSDPRLVYSGYVYPGVAVLSRKDSGRLLSPVRSESELRARLISATVGITRDAEFVEYIKSVGLWDDSLGYVSDRVAGLILDGIPAGERDAGIFSCVSTLYSAGFRPEGIRFLVGEGLKRTGGDTAGNITKLDSAIKRVCGVERDPRYYRSRSACQVGVRRNGSAVIDERAVAEERGRIIDSVCSRVGRFFRDETKTVFYTLSSPETLRFCPNMDQLEYLVRPYLLETRLPVIKKANGVHFVGSEVGNPSKVLDEWVRSSAGLDVEPAEFRFKSDSGFCIHRLGFDPEAGDTPAWDEFLGRLNCSDSFLAWVGGVLDLNNKGRQAAYLVGFRGQDGKSVVARVLGSLFGDAHATMNTDTSTQFMYYPLYKKRFVTIPDLKDTGFVKTSQFRKIVSGDPVSIERKGYDAFTTQLNVKVLICSNYLPNTTSGNADLSRLLILHVSPSPTPDDETWEQRLRAELPQFVHRCIETYRRLVPEGKALIPLPESSRRLLQAAAKSSEVGFSVAFKKLFDLDPRATIRESVTEEEVYVLACDTRFGDRILVHRRDFKRFVTYLNTEHGIELVYSPERGGNVLLGLRTKQSVDV